MHPPDGAAPLPNTTCPACGEPNGCSPAQAGRFDVPCWCSQAVVHPQALARVPADRRGKACLCRRCLTQPPAEEPAADPR
jgi:hypothetical protein